METEKRRRLTASGWKVGTVAEFLELAPEEAILVEIKVALARDLRERRRGRMARAELAAGLQSNLPRIAIVEQADSSVSMELLIRAMLAVGATPGDIGRLIASVGEGKQNAVGD